MRTVTALQRAAAAEQATAAQTAAAADKVAAAEKAGKPLFVPSASFAGAKPGYAFKSGDRGLGYYLDLESADMREVDATPPDDPPPSAKGAQHQEPCCLLARAGRRELNPG